MESHYAPQISVKRGAPAKTFKMVFGAVYIQQRLGVPDRETVELITKSPYLVQPWNNKSCRLIPLATRG